MMQVGPDGDVRRFGYWLREEAKEFQIERLKKLIVDD